MNAQTKPVTPKEVNDDIDSLIIQIRLTNPNGQWNKAVAAKLKTIKEKFAALDAYADELRRELDSK